MKIEVGPTGYLVRGDVLDCNAKSLDRAVKKYDPQLYLKWRPEKNHGYGQWELRRRPDHKSIVETIQLNGITIHKLQYKEWDIENHVFNLEHLGYDLLDKLKRCDVWSKIGYEKGKTNRVDQFLNTVDKNYNTKKATDKQKNYDEAVYQMKQGKTFLKRFQEDIQSGYNPANLMRYWK